MHRLSPPRRHSKERYDNGRDLKTFHSYSFERNHEDHHRSIDPYLPDHREHRDRSRDRHEPPLEEEEGALFFTDCVLYPPKPHDKPVYQRKKKPPGCKTLYLGGIPGAEISAILQRVRNILEEVFSTNGGPVESVFVRDKGFGHVRFCDQESLEGAMLVNGYYIRIPMPDAKPVVFRLFLEYSDSKGDKEEYERKAQIAVKMDIKPEEVPNLLPFNHSNVESVIFKLKGSRKEFVDAVTQIRAWIDQEKVEKSSVDSFFTMFQTIHSQSNRFIEDGQEIVRSFENKRNMFNEDLGVSVNGLRHLVNVYQDSQKQKCWQQLTKQQRRSVSNWLNEAKKAQNNLQSNMCKTTKETEKENGKDMENKDSQLAALKKTLEDTQQKVWDLIKDVQSKDDLLKSRNKDVDSLTKELDDIKKVETGKKRKLDSDDYTTDVSKKQQKMLCTLSVLLQVYPKGADIPTMTDYLLQNGIKCSEDDIDTILLTYPDLFTMTFQAVGSGTVKKWKSIFLECSN